MIALVLRHRFLVGPVLLSSLTKRFDGLEHRAAFAKLARDYLPEQADRLVSMPIGEAPAAFLKLFSARYFPIEMPAKDWNGGIYENGRYRMANGMERLLRRIPLEWHGFLHWDYESFWHMEKAQVLAEALSKAPDSRCNRTPAVARLRETLGAAADGMMARIPAGGWAIEDLENGLAGFRLPGLLAWCRWLHGRTGNIWLDTPPERAARGRMWTRANVNELTAAWAGYRDLDRQMQAFNSVIGHDFAGVAREAVDWIAAHVPQRVRVGVRVG